MQSAMSSSPLRIELRVSNLMRAALLVVAACAALALWRSDVPRAALLVVPVLLVGPWRRLDRLPWHELVLRSDGTAAGLNANGDETAVSPRRLLRRGPLWVLELDAPAGRVALLFGPDTLDPVQRRSLRLWVERHVEREPSQVKVAHV